MTETEDHDGSDYGDFAKTGDDEDDIEEEAEPWEQYQEMNSRLYYPLCIGEILNQRYRIEHKVGHGGFSTVWMAHDLQDKRDVALKIMISGKETGERELEIHNEILDKTLLILSPS